MPGTVLRRWAQERTEWTQTPPQGTSHSSREGATGHTNRTPGTGDTDHSVWRGERRLQFYVLGGCRWRAVLGRAEGEERASQPGGHPRRLSEKQRVQDPERGGCLGNPKTNKSLHLANCFIIFIYFYFLLLFEHSCVRSPHTQRCRKAPPFSSIGGSLKSRHLMPLQLSDGMRPALPGPCCPLGVWLAARRAPGARGPAWCPSSQGSRPSAAFGLWTQATAGEAPRPATTLGPHVACMSRWREVSSEHCDPGNEPKIELAGKNAQSLPSQNNVTLTLKPCFPQSLF